MPEGVWEKLTRRPPTTKIMLIIKILNVCACNVQAIHLRMYIRAADIALLPHLTLSPPTSLSNQVKLTPNSPIMKVFIVFAALVSVAVSQYADAPIPYSFNYIAETEDGGSSGHQESGDGSGRVTGSYTVTNLEGHSRTVDYIADENGFQPTIRTNEPGTANINPADVIMESSAPESGAFSYSLGASGGASGYGMGGGRPVSRPAAPASTGGRAGVRYVLVPSTDPRATGYY